MQGAPPLLSFVVPLYNCLPLTQAMVASLQGSLPAGLEHEIILVDDGSTDGTRAWLATLGAPFRVILNEGNLGYGAANNRGAAAARGHLLALLNNDLVLGPGWLEPMLSLHAQFGRRAGVIGNIQIDARTGALDHAGIFINHQGKPEHDRTPRWQLRIAHRFQAARRAPAVTGACVLLARDLWQELHGFDQGYVNGCEDVDFCLRAMAAGYRNAVALGSVVRHHISAAPGRKRNDEANTYRLTLRWRNTLVPLGIHHWCRHYFETYLPEPRDFPDPPLARQLAFYLLRLRRRPPPGAYPGMGAAIDIEIARWRAMLGEPTRP